MHRPRPCIFASWPNSCISLYVASSLEAVLHYTMRAISLAMATWLLGMSYIPLQRTSTEVFESNRLACNTSVIYISWHSVLCCTEDIIIRYERNDQDGFQMPFIILIILQECFANRPIPSNLTIPSNLPNPANKSANSINSILYKGWLIGNRYHKWDWRDLGANSHSDLVDHVTFCCSTQS